MGLGITVLSIGKRDDTFAGGVEELCRLIRPHASIEVVRLRAPGRQDGRPESLAAEAALLRRHWPQGAHTVGLSQEGLEMDSTAFAAWLGDRRLEARPLTFSIGGAYGLDGNLKRACRDLLSLSPLTLSHRVALLVLLEQLYRGFTILAGHPYHK